MKSKKKTYEQAKQTRNRLIDIENNLAVTRGRDVEQKQVKGIKRYMLPVMK